MKPVKRNDSDFEYERVQTNVFVNGVIEEIQRDENRVTRFEGKESIRDCVRFKFKLDGMQFSRYSRWESFSYSAKSNLFKKYLVALVPNARAGMDFDLSSLVGKKIKTLWVQNGEYQNLQLIVPADSTATADVEQEEAPI